MLVPTYSASFRHILIPQSLLQASLESSIDGASPERQVEVLGVMSFALRPSADLALTVQQLLSTRLIILEEVLLSPLSTLNLSLCRKV
jgi:hypothetical protein